MRQAHFPHFCLRWVPSNCCPGVLSHSRGVCSPRSELLKRAHPLTPRLYFLSFKGLIRPAQGKDPGLVRLIRPAVSGSILARPISGVLHPAPPAGLLPSSKSPSCSLPWSLSNSRSAVQLSQTPPDKARCPALWGPAPRACPSPPRRDSLRVCFRPLSAPPTTANP